MFDTYSYAKRTIKIWCTSAFIWTCGILLSLLHGDFLVAGVLAPPTFLVCIVIGVSIKDLRLLKAMKDPKRQSNSGDK